MTSITFETVDPTEEPGEYMSIQDPGGCVYLTEDGLEESLRMMQNKDDIVIQKGQISVVFSYPLDKEYVLTLFASEGKDHFTRGDLARAVGTKYQQIYREEEESTMIVPETYAEMNARLGNGGIMLLNRVMTDGKWGIWGHCLGDLVLHEVRFDNGHYRPRWIPPGRCHRSAYRNFPAALPDGSSLVHVETCRG